MVRLMNFWVGAQAHLHLGGFGLLGTSFQYGPEVDNGLYGATRITSTLFGPTSGAFLDTVQFGQGNDRPSVGSITGVQCEREPHGDLLDLEFHSLVAIELSEKPLQNFSAGKMSKTSQKVIRQIMETTTAAVTAQNTRGFNGKHFARRLDNDFFGVFTTLSAVVFALIKNHVLLQEHSKKLEVLFQLVNSLKDKTK